MTLIKVEKKYEFEVAFSFLEDDEKIAYEINDTIQDRYSTFIYSQHQKEIVGTDGAETFRQVFEEKSRIVVVIYREQWGKTFWTRIEENAIKHRVLEESADFTIFVSLDGNKPKWLSKTQIWYDYNRFGAKSTAAIIEKKITEYGGEIREETIFDQAERHKRELLFQKELITYLASNQAYSDASTEVRNLLSDAESNINKITDHSIQLSFGNSKKENEYYICFGKNHGLSFNWKCRNNNSLNDSYLEVLIANGEYFDRNPNRPGRVYKKEKYKFYKNITNQKGWVQFESKKNFISSSQLVNSWQKEFLEKNQKDKIEEGKKYIC